MRWGVRDGGVLFSDGEDYLVILFFAERVQVGEEGGFNGLNWHEGGHDRYLMDGVDARCEIVGIQLLLEQLEGVNILHKI
jgi:hypothetical protein